MLGTHFAGFAGNAGTEQVAQMLATIPAAGENPSLCYSTGECLQATQLSPLLPLPCPSLLQGGPSSLLALHPSIQCRKRRGHAAHTAQTDGRSDTGACTGTPHAHRVEPATAQAPCLLDSHSPHTPRAGARGSQHWVRQAAAALPAARVPVGALAGEPWHRSCHTGGERPARGGWHWQRVLLQDLLWVPATLGRSQSAHLPTSLNQGKRS